MKKIILKPAFYKKKTESIRSGIPRVYLFFKELSDALTFSSLSLIIIKIFYFNLFQEQLEIKINIYFFILGIVLGYKFDLLNKIKDKTAEILYKILPNEYVRQRATFGFENRHDLRFMNKEENKEIEEMFEESYFKFLIWNFLCFFIFIRLWISLEPIVFIIINFIFIQSLLLNKYLMATYIIGLILNISKIVFFISDKSYNDIKNGLINYTPNQNKIKKENYIRLSPTYTNVKLCLFWIICTFEDRELFIIFRKKKEEEFNSGEDYQNLINEYYNAAQYNIKCPRILNDLIKTYESKIMKKIEIILKKIKKQIDEI